MARKRAVVSELSERVEEYLTTRRALGFKLAFPGCVLPQFAAYLEAAGAEHVTTDLAIAWAGLPQGHVLPISLAHRLGAVRGFARWLKTIDPATEVPPCGIWPSTSPRPTPRIWSKDEIWALLEAARQLVPALRGATYEHLFGLLAATGMRIGEALLLERGDVDLETGVVTVRDGKFGRTRLVPLHPSVTGALSRYAAQRDQLCPAPTSSTFFVTARGGPLRASPVHDTFNKLATAIGLRDENTRARIHGLRHSFVVATLLEWHRAGTDVGSRMAHLSNYLGHLNAEGTYWYFSAVPELMALVAARIETGEGASA